MKAPELWLGAAALRATEVFRPPEGRLFDDELSLALLPTVRPSHGPPSPPSKEDTETVPPGT